jgi:ParB/RepB/Spo0J family partition protein
MRDSVAAVGIMNPFNVREKTEDVDGTTISYFELIDGLHRLSCAIDVGLAEVPVQVLVADDAKTLEMQVIANAQKVETKHAEYAAQMQRILTSNPTMTLSELGNKICKSGAWVSQHLNLLKLADDIKVLVDEGKIKLTNAYNLAKLPVEEQINFIDQAMSEAPDVFVPNVLVRVKEIAKARREGRKVGEATFTPTPKLRKLADLKAEYNSPTAGPALCDSTKVKSVTDAFALGVAWAINLDPSSVAIQEAKAEEKAQQLAEAKQKRAADRAKKQAEEAAAKAAELAEKAEALN